MLCLAVELDAMQEATLLVDDDGGLGDLAAPFTSKQMSITSATSRQSSHPHSFHNMDGKPSTESPLAVLKIKSDPELSENTARPSFESNMNSIKSPVLRPISAVRHFESLPPIHQLPSHLPCNIV